MGLHIAERLRKIKSKAPAAKALAGIAWLGTLSSEQLQLFAARGVVERGPVDQVLFREGVPPDTIYLILSGSVKLCRQNNDGTDREIRIAGAGELLGLLSIVDGAPRSATATVLESCELLVFERDDFFQTVAEFPQILPHVLSSIAGKVRTERDQLLLEWKKLRLEMVRERFRSVAHALEATNKAKTVEEAMQRIVDQICLQTGWPVGHAYIVDSEGGELKLASSAWHLASPERFEPFRRLTDGTLFGPGVGIPGRVLDKREAIWVADLREGMNNPRAALAKRLGLLSAFAVPILLDDRVVAALEFFSDRQAEADELLMEAMNSIGTQLGRIIENKRYEEQLIHNAVHDPLTGLPNRALLLEHLKQSLARQQRHRSYLFAVLFVDLDRFKVVNDSLGHVLGDCLLVEIARRIQACLRPMDMVARLGGDEFAILLDDISTVMDATRTVERIREKLQLPLPLNGHELFTSASIGIALSSPGYDRPEQLLRDADTAMYRAKEDSKGQYKVFDVSMHARAVNELQLENDLRRAIDRGELRLHYQPIISLETGRIVGFEALVRWQHPARGWLPPDEFIPLAEETELIIPLTQWVLNEACSRIKKWQSLMPPDARLSVSVNLSTKHLAKPSIIDEIAGTLSHHDLAASSLTLEITESQLMENAEALSQILARLSDLGIKVSIDDFGTGYSSLSYLSGFPVHALKIDRNFVRKLSEDERNAAIVRAIVSLGQNLGLDVIAEGVETPKQLNFLRGLQCLYGQGYYFFAPMEHEAVAASLVQDASANSEKKVRLSRLCAFDLFDGQPDEALSDIAEHSRDVMVPSGAVIIEEGQVSDHVYLLEQGSLGIHRTEAGVSQFLGVLESPAFLGEMLVLHSERRWTARVKALTDLRLLAIPVRDCIDFLRKSPAFKRNLERLVAGRKLIEWKS